MKECFILLASEPSRKASGRTVCVISQSGGPTGPPGFAFFAITSASAFRPGAKSLSVSDERSEERAEKGGGVK